MSATAELLRDLVRLPSVNPMGRALHADILYEQRVTGYLEHFLRRLGLPCQRQHVAPQRDNLIARRDVGSPVTLLLEVHQDTVPVDGMTIAPFAGHVEGTRLYGRGACDVKGGMVAMLRTLARLVEDRPARSANVVLACTVDEEHTSLGVKELARQGIRADYAIVAEPTQLNIVHAHKGICRWTISTAGRACHSSRPAEGVNAVYRMGRLLTEVDRYAAQLSRDRCDALLGPATLSVGRIEGGASVNTVPDHCQIDVDRRLLPGEDSAQCQRELRDFLQSLDFAWEASEPWVHMPALSAAGSERLVELLGDAIRPTRGDFSVHPVPFGTDAPWIAGLGIPTVIFGPGDIAQAHTKDEWIDLDAVDAAADVLYRLALTLGS